MYEGRLDHDWDWVASLRYTVAAFSMGGSDQMQPLDFHPLYQAKLAKAAKNTRLSPRESIELLASVFMRGEIQE